MPVSRARQSIRRSARSAWLACGCGNASFAISDRSGGRGGASGCRTARGADLIAAYSPSISPVMTIFRRKAMARALPSGVNSGSFHPLPRGVCWTIRGTLIEAACAGFAGRGM